MRHERQFHGDLCVRNSSGCVKLIYSCFLVFPLYQSGFVVLCFGMREMQLLLVLFN